MHLAFSLFFLLYPLLQDVRTSLQAYSDNDQEEHLCLDYKIQISTKVYTGLLGVISIPVQDVVAILAHEPALVKRFLFEVQPLDEPMSLKDPILHLDLGPQSRNQGKDHRIGD